MTGMITRVGDGEFLLQGRANPEAAYDAVGIDGARGSETVSQILAWADENLTQDEKKVLAEELSISQKTRRILDLLSPCLTQQELAAVAKILNGPSGEDIGKFLEARVTPQHMERVRKVLDQPESPKDILGEDGLRWKSADHYRHTYHTMHADRTRIRERQEKVEREWRERRAAEADFRKRYPNAPEVDKYDVPAKREPIADGSDAAEFYSRFPDARKIGHV